MNNSWLTRFDTRHPLVIRNVRRTGRFISEK